MGSNTDGSCNKIYRWVNVRIDDGISSGIVIGVLVGMSGGDWGCAGRYNLYYASV